MENALTRAFWFALYWALRPMPLRIVRAAARLLGWLAYVLWVPRRRIALDNLRHAFPEKTEAERRRIARGAFVNIATTLLEFLVVDRISDEQFAQLVRMRGEEHFARALEQGKGAIYLTAHFGNWEWMGRRIVLGGFPLDVLARTQDDERTESLVHRLRSACGMRVIPRASSRAALRTLRENRILGILGDQHSIEASTIVDFFGRPAATPIGPYVFARRTGAPIIIGFCFRQQDGTYEFELSPPMQLVNSGDRQADDKANAQQFNRVLEQAVRARPDHWLWMHRRWRPAECADARALSNAQR